MCDDNEMDCISSLPIHHRRAAREIQAVARRAAEAQDITHGVRMAILLACIEARTNLPLYLDVRTQSALPSEVAGGRVPTGRKTQTVRGA